MTAEMERVAQKNYNTIDKDMLPISTVDFVPVLLCFTNMVQQFLFIQSVFNTANTK